MSESESSEDLFTKIHSFNGCNEQILPDRAEVGCTHAEGDDLSSCPNHAHCGAPRVQRSAHVTSAVQPSAPSSSSRVQPSVPPSSSLVQQSVPPSASGIQPSAPASASEFQPSAPISASQIQSQHPLPALAQTLRPALHMTSTHASGQPPLQTIAQSSQASAQIPPLHQSSCPAASRFPAPQFPYRAATVVGQRTASHVPPQGSTRIIHMSPFLATPQGTQVTDESCPSHEGRGDAPETEAIAASNPPFASATRRAGIRGRGARRRGAATAAKGTRNDPTTGWRVKTDVSETIISESEFLDSYLIHRVRLFMISAMHRLNLESDVRELSKSRADILVLFIDEVLHACMMWLNEFVRLKGIQDMAISMSDMYKYLAVLLYSHCTGFSMKKVISVLGADEGWSISKVLINFIHGNILAYSPTGRGADSSVTWNAQRDQTIHLPEFERKTFRMSAKVYLNPNHTFCTLDDDLMGTRAEDNQCKTISARKADREGQSMTAVADALFRVFLHARLGGRGESKKVAVTKLLSELLDNRGERCLDGIVLTLDRGYATEQMVSSLIDSRVACITVMKNVSVRGHPFVGRSYLTVGRDDDSDEDVDLRNESTGQVPIRPDRPTAFIIEDAPNFGNGSFRAVKTFGSGRRSQLVNAIAVRCHGNAKHANIVRFLHAVPSLMHDCLQHWVTSHYTWDMEPYLFNKNRNGRIRIPLQEDEVTSKKHNVEVLMTERAKVLTAGQRCADWFLMREFRLTSTSAAKFLLRSPQYRVAVGLPPAEPLSDSPSQVSETLSKSWFSTSRSTEEMTRGTVNENAVINAFAQHSYIDSVYKVGMFCDKERPWLAASPDAIAVFDIDACNPDYVRSDEPVDLRLAEVEIKTAVARGNVAAGINIASPELVLCNMDTDVFREYVPKEHAAQMAHQCVLQRLGGFSTSTHPSLRFCMSCSPDVPTNLFWTYKTFTMIGLPGTMLGSW